MRRMELDAIIWYGASLSHLESSPKGASNRYFIFFQTPISRHATHSLISDRIVLSSDMVSSTNILVHIALDSELEVFFCCCDFVEVFFLEISLDISFQILFTVNAFSNWVVFFTYTCIPLLLLFYYHHIGTNC